MNRHLKISLGAFALAVLSQAAAAQDASRLDVSTDMRLRFEQDWDSQTASGTPRADRARARVRARVHVRAELMPGLIARGRVRTASEGSQQGSNATFADFDDHRTEDIKLLVDRYSLAWQGASGRVEAGRMALPFFTPNEYFWDGDISPLGVAGSVGMPLGDAATLKLHAGGFELPVGLRDYSGNLFAAQAVLESGATTLAAGWFGFDADRDDADRLLLLDGNGSRDYRILAINAQYKLPVFDRALALNADYYRNLERYSHALDPVSLANRDERTGYVISAAWGDTREPGRFQLGYRFFRMEKLSVNASYAHDDVARFGTSAQAALTDLTGHDLYANYAVTGALTIGMRAMFVERLRSREDGKRARVDFVYVW